MRSRLKKKSYTKKSSATLETRDNDWKDNLASKRRTTQGIYTEYRCGTKTANRTKLQLGLGKDFKIKQEIAKEKPLYVLYTTIMTVGLCQEISLMQTAALQV